MIVDRLSCGSGRSLSFPDTSQYIGTFHQPVFRSEGRAVPAARTAGAKALRHGRARRAWGRGAGGRWTKSLQGFTAWDCGFHPKDNGGCRGCSRTIALVGVRTSLIFISSPISGSLNLHSRAYQVTSLMCPPRSLLHYRCRSQVTYTAVWGH